MSTHSCAPYFVNREGMTFACWGDGRQAVPLGPQGAVLSAMRDFVASPLSLVPEPAETGHLPAPRIDRAQKRHDLQIFGRVFTITGSRDVAILDLSSDGCRIRDKGAHLTPGARVTLKIGPIGPLTAEVKWRQDAYVGMQFETALYPSVLEHIRRHFDNGSLALG